MKKCFLSKWYSEVIDGKMYFSIPCLCDELAEYATHGARLLLSGILLDQEQEILEAFAKAGAMFSQRREQEGWVALELLMGESCEGARR